MTLQDDIKKLAAKSKTNKIIITTLALIVGGLLIALGIPEQGKQLITIGEETAAVEVTDGKITAVTSATSSVTVNEFISDTTGK